MRKQSCQPAEPSSGATGTGACETLVLVLALPLVLLLLVWGVSSGAFVPLDNQ